MGKVKYVCASCKKDVSENDSECPHCKAVLEPMTDAVKAKSVRDFKVGRASIPVFTERLKLQLQNYAHGKGIGDKDKMSKAKEVIRMMTNELNKAVKE